MGRNSAGPWFLQLKNVGESRWVEAASWLPYSDWGWAGTRHLAHLGLRLPSWPTRGLPHHSLRVHQGGQPRGPSSLGLESLPLVCSTDDRVLFGGGGLSRWWLGL